MKKRLLSIITALALCLSLCPIGAFAADGTDPTTPLPKEKIAKITGVDFTLSYKADMGHKIYSAEPVDVQQENLIFKTAEGDFAAPTDEEIHVDIDKKWYVGRNPGSSASSVSAPKDVGSYTLRVTVTVTAPDPDPTPDTSSTLESRLASGKHEAELVFDIKQKEVAPTLRTGIKKPYDGTSAYEPEGDSPFDLQASGICPNDYDLVSFIGTFSFDSSKVGARTLLGMNINITGDAKGNYTLKPGSAEVPAEITKASAPVSSASPTLTVRNRRAHIYRYALEERLPALPAGQEYGTITPSIQNIEVLYSDFFHNNDHPAEKEVNVTANELTLDISEANHDGRNRVAAIILLIASDNFNKFSLTLQVYSDDKTGITITGLEPVSPPYDGTPLLGYAGMPQYSQTEGTAGTEMPEYDASELDHSYEGIHGTDYGPTEEPPTEPGDYTVTLSIPEADGDFTGSWTSQFTITKAIVTVTAMERKIKVDDPVPDLSRPVLDVDYTVTGLAEGDELKFPPTMKYATVADSISDGEFEILIDGAMVPDMDHYDPAIKYVSGKLIVTSLSDKDENPFSDVSEYAWYVTAVKYVYNEGLMKGTTNTLFSPTSNITRGMMVTILYRMEGEPKVWSTNPFTDVDEDEYYYDAIRWANSEHIVQGYGNGRFGPNDALTREQLAIIFYNYSRYNAVNVNKAASLDRFVDAKYTSPAGYRALQWACAEKLIQGTGSTTLSPNAKALRAQVAVILMRYRTSVAPPPAKPEETPPEV